MGAFQRFHSLSPSLREDAQWRRQSTQEREIRGEQGQTEEKKIGFCCLNNFCPKNFTFIQIFVLNKGPKTGGEGVSLQKNIPTGRIEKDGRLGGHTLQGHPPVPTSVGIIVINPVHSINRKKSMQMQGQILHPGFSTGSQRQGGGDFLGIVPLVEGTPNGGTSLTAGQ